MCQLIILDQNSLHVLYIAFSDGKYHVSVRALNQVEFGGPLALHICHYTPYVVDTSPPIVHSLENVTYDELVLLLEFDVSVHGGNKFIWFPSIVKEDQQHFFLT